MIMTKKDLLTALQYYPDDMPVNVFIQYNGKIILRAPGVEINYVSADGTINVEPVSDVKEIALFVVECMYNIKRNNNL